MPRPWGPSLDLHSRSRKKIQFSLANETTTLIGVRTHVTTQRFRTWAQNPFGGHVSRIHSFSSKPLQEVLLALSEYIAQRGAEESREEFLEARGNIQKWENIYDRHF